MRGGNIRTVLIEKDVTPPPTIISRQWLDLTEWQKFRNLGAADESLLKNPEFIKWFGEKSHLLIEMLETRENREFEGQITTIKKALPALYFATSRQIFLLKEYYVERTWMREKVESWLDDPHGESVCIIYGDPGIGKSAFSAHYAHYNGRVATAIFCEKGQNALNRPEAVVQTLAYLLACRIADYREYLADLLEGKAVGSFQNDSTQSAPQNIGSLSVDEMFDILIATPLLHLIDGERPVECILVDGLDEAGSTENNELAAVLQKYSSRLPKWLRILVLSRNISAVQKWFGEARKINLTAEIRENREDLERFVRERLKEYGDESDALEKAIETIVSQSDGVFLYAKITVDALLDGKISLDEVQTFPRGLDQIYLRWFQWYVPDISTYDAKVRPAMNLMAASPEAIPEEEIIGAAGWRRKQLADFKRLMQVHLREGTNDSGEKTLDFSHLYVREWLVSPAASEYQIFVDDGILEMAEFFDEVISDEEPEISEFEARYVLTIMERAAALNRSMRRAYREAMRNEALMKRQEKLGRHCQEWNRFYAAQEYLVCALQIAQCRTDDEDTAENRKHIVICKNRLARIEQSLGHGEAVKRLNEEALEVARQNVAERGWPEDLNRAAVSLLMIADYVDDQEEALRYFREAGELLEQAAATLEQGALEHGTSEVDDEESDDEHAVRLKVDRNRSIVHNRMGRAALMRGDYTAAAASYFEDLKIAQRLAMETGKPEARRDFAVSCYKLAEVYRNCDDMEEAIYYYSLALRTMDILSEQRGQPEDIRGLIVLLSSRGSFMKWGGNQSSGELELLRSYERALALSRKMVSKYGMAKDELFVADALANIGFVLKALGNSARAVESMKEAIVIYTKYEPNKAENLKLWIEKCEV